MEKNHKMPLKLEIKLMLITMGGVSYILGWTGFALGMAASLTGAG